jgi:hypothetical protein
VKFLLIPISGRIYRDISTLRLGQTIPQTFATLGY